MTEAVFYPGHVEFEAIELIAGNGRKIDIRLQMVEMNMFEDLLSNVITGSILVDDAFDFIYNLPIIGEETLHLVYKTPSINDNFKIDKYFSIYKVSDVLYEKNKMKYVLHFISPEAITDLNKSVSKVFGGNCSDLIESVLREKFLIGTDKKLYVEKSNNLVKFISAFWSPFKIINWISKRALNKNKNANYVFYESTRGFEFNSISTLFGQNPYRKLVFDEYTRDTNTNRSSSLNYEETYKRVLNLGVDIMIDYIERLKSGMYASRIQIANLTTKSISSLSYEYLKNFDSSTHLNRYPLNSENLLRKKNSTLVFKNNISHGFDQSQNSYSQWYLQRLALLAQASAIKLNIEVHGRTDYYVGQVIELTVPAKNMISDQDNSQDLINSKLSGNYLISAINHKFTINQHRIHAELIKDSFGEKV